MRLQNRTKAVNRVRPGLNDKRGPTGIETLPVSAMGANGMCQKGKRSPTGIETYWIKIDQRAVGKSK